MVSESIRNKYQLVVGLEVHAQLSTASKTYCADPNTYGALPNTQISPISLGHPGTLPVLNEKTVDFAIRLGLALNCQISSTMHFARKNYFYPDLPKGYQITQDTTPICTGGFIDINDAEGKVKRIGITRIHMEEDAGKSIHDVDPFHTLVDLNRAGVPLLEIVSEPDLRSIEEAYNYLAEIRKLVRYLEVCDGNMEEGSLRCDANVSVMIKGSDTLGTRCEVKNMNSLRNVQRAIEFEMNRQIDILEAGGTIEQQTRSFDAVSGTTSLLRGKEDAHDYRYFPEPDLTPLHLTSADIERVRKALPPLPHELFDRYTKKLGLSAYDAALLTEDKPTALFFEELLKAGGKPKPCANWLMGEVRGWLNQKALEIDRFPLTAPQLVKLIDLIDQGIISHSAAAQRLFPDLCENPEADPGERAKMLNLIQNSDENALREWALQALAAFPDKVAAYKSGNKALMGLFMGEVMKLSERKADPKSTSKILTELLNQ